MATHDRLLILVVVKGETNSLAKRQALIVNRLQAFRWVKMGWY